MMRGGIGHAEEHEDRREAGAQLRGSEEMVKTISGSQAQEQPQKIEE
jgi:hypothetical protein